MSCVRCDGCSEIIDSDDDPECFTEGANGVPGDGPVRCENCREDHLCLECGERQQQCDDYCVPCQVAFYLANPAEFDPDETTPDGRRLHDLPGFREAATQYKAAQVAA